MYAISVLEQLRIPVQVEDIEELQNAGIVYPEDAVIVLSCTIGVVVELRAQRRGPVHRVQLGVVPAPTEVGPGVL